MITFDYKIQDEIGLHARPAGLLVKEAKAFTSSITVKCNGKTADALKLMAIMALGVKHDDTVTVEVAGDDEVQAAEALEAFFRTNL